MLHAIGFDHFVVIAHPHRKPDLEDQIAGFDLLHQSLGDIGESGGLVYVVLYAFKETNLSTHFCRL